MARCGYERHEEEEKHGTHEDLVEEVLDELFLQSPRREQAVEVGAEELCDDVPARREPGRGARGRHVHVF